MLARALIASALALLISGDPARLGWGATAPWHFLFPYLWLFILLESAGARRRLGDEAVFLAGAAMAMLYGGVYAKDLQHGLHPFGVDWLGALSAMFDGGMTAVLALHVAGFLLPGADRGSAESGPLTMVFLVFCLGTGAAIYCVKTAFNFYQADRMLGATWLVADVLFLGAALALARRARRRAEDDEAGREPWIWGLAGFAVWLPGARLIARACAAAALPDALLYFFVAGWTAAALAVGWGLWRERAHVDPAAVARSRSGAAAALWRAAGALLLASALGAQLTDDETAGIFSAAIDWPSRALFAWAFFTSKLAV